MKAKLGTNLNVNYQLRDKNGNAKPLFVENKLGMFLLKAIRKAQSIMPRHLVLNGLQVPFLTGTYAFDKNISNLVTNAGKASVAGLLTGDVTNFFDYIAVGTGTTAANVADTTLETESATAGLSRATSTNSQVTTDVTNDTAQFVKSFSVTGSVAVTESGVLDASSAGTLLCRQVFSAINVVNGDTLQITWKIDVD